MSIATILFEMTVKGVMNCLERVGQCFNHEACHLSNIFLNSKRLKMASNCLFIH